MFRSTTFRTASEPVAGGHFHLSDFQSWGLAYARWAKQPNMMGCRKDTQYLGKFERPKPATSPAMVRSSKPHRGPQSLSGLVMLRSP